MNAKPNIFLRSFYLFMAIATALVDSGETQTIPVVWTNQVSRSRTSVTTNVITSTTTETEQEIRTNYFTPQQLSNTNAIQTNFPYLITANGPWALTTQSNGILVTNEVISDSDDTQFPVLLHAPGNSLQSNPVPYFIFQTTNAVAITNSVLVTNSLPVVTTTVNAPLFTFPWPAGTNESGNGVFTISWLSNGLAFSATITNTTGAGQGSFLEFTGTSDYSIQ